MINCDSVSDTLRVVLQQTLLGITFDLGQVSWSCSDLLGGDCDLLQRVSYLCVERRPWPWRWSHSFVWPGVSILLHQGGEVFGMFEAASSSQLRGSSLVSCAFPGFRRRKLESLLSPCDQLGLTGTLQLSAEQ